MLQNYIKSFSEQINTCLPQYLHGKRVFKKSEVIKGGKYKCCTVQ